MKDARKIAKDLVFDSGLSLQEWACLVDRIEEAIEQARLDGRKGAK